MYYTVFAQLIESICMLVMEPEKNERTHFYDNYILANYCILDKYISETL